MVPMVEIGSVKLNALPGCMARMWLQLGMANDKLYDTQNDKLYDTDVL
jgi:hypothetical protein